MYLFKKWEPLKPTELRWSDDAYGMYRYTSGKINALKVRAGNLCLLCLLVSFLLRLVGYVMIPFPALEYLAGALFVSAIFMAVMFAYLHKELHDLNNEIRGD